MIFELFMRLFIYPLRKRHDHVKTILCIALSYLYTVYPEVQQHQIRSFLKANIAHYQTNLPCIWQSLDISSYVCICKSS